jgi:hypothetical protein
MSRLLCIAALAVVTLTGCAAESATDGPTQRPSTLLDPAQWQVIDEDASVFSARYPADASCSVGSMRVEYTVLELNTTDCDAITAGQAIERDVAKGTPMGLDFWHLALWAEEPATGYAAVAVGETVLWEMTTPIPADPAHYGVKFDAPRALQAGELLQVFVTNHGANSWKLLDVYADDGGPL